MKKINYRFGDLNYLIQIIKRIRILKYGFVIFGNIDQNGNKNIQFMRLWNRYDEMDQMFYDSLIYPIRNASNEQSLDALYVMREINLTRELCTEINNVYKLHETKRKELKIRPKDIFHGFVAIGKTLLIVSRRISTDEDIIESTINLRPYSITQKDAEMMGLVMERIVNLMDVNKPKKIYNLTNFTVPEDMSTLPDNLRFISEKLEVIINSFYKVGEVVNAISVFETKFDDMVHVKLIQKIGDFIECKTFMLVI